MGIVWEGGFKGVGREGANVLRVHHMCGNVMMQLVIAHARY